MNNEDLLKELLKELKDINKNLKAIKDVLGA